MGQLTGRRALVTGASRGIGEAIATAFAREGAQVVIVSRKADPLLSAADRIRAAVPGATVFALAGHVGKVDTLPGLVQQAAELLGGPIDALVNNAGTNPYFGPMLGTSWEAWRKTFDVNLDGPFGLAKAVALGAMEAKLPATIVNVSSILGARAAPMQGVYGLTKAALISLTQTLAVELAAASIRVNAIAPGVVDTRLAAAIVHDDAVRAHVLGHVPLARVASPDEIAGAALFLTSAASSYVTGTVLYVDGGYTAL